MINIRFDFNKDALLQQLAARAQAISDKLATNPIKTFTIDIGTRTYQCRYEIDGHQVTLYAYGSGSGASSLVTPTLTLSLGHILLPESMSLPDDPDTLADPVYVPTTEIRYSGLSDNEIHQIMAKIKEKGLINILKIA